MEQKMTGHDARRLAPSHLTRAFRLQTFHLQSKEEGIRSPWMGCGSRWDDHPIPIGPAAPKLARTIIELRFDPPQRTTVANDLR